MEGGEGGLEPGHAHRRLLERDLLLVARVRRVVGGDALDRAVAQALDQRLAVVLGAQRRVHLEAVRVEAAHLLVGEAEVVRGRLAADPHPARPWRRARASTDSRRGEVLEVDAARPRSAASAASRAIIVDSETEGMPARPSAARDRRPRASTPVAGERGVLLVQGDRAAAEPLVLERAPQQPGRWRPAGRRR